MTLRAINNDIIFEFIQKLESGTFVNKTEWGLEIKNQVEDVKQPKWGKVLHIGPDVDADIKIDQYVLIEALMWTNKVSYAGYDFWKTNDSKIIAISEKKPTNLV